MSKVNKWQSQDAKAHFSELIQASQKAPQTITVHGIAKSVVLSQKEYELLKGKKLNFIDFMNQSPLKGLNINFERDKSLGREDIDL